MTFRPHPFEAIVPTRSDEVIEPTRVVWTKACGMVTSRIFPTEARARTFAGDLGPDTHPIVQHAFETPPKQPLSVVLRAPKSFRRGRYS